MTGWGRTGTLFACEQADIAPDIACHSKGLTGGSLPLAVKLCRGAIFDAHYSKDRTRTFFHSSSYTANPIACAAARANLELWQQDARERVALIAAMQERLIAPFRNDARFSNVRRTGTITALDRKASDPGYLADIGPKLRTFFVGAKSAAPAARQYDLPDAALLRHGSRSEGDLRKHQGCCRRAGLKIWFGRGATRPDAPKQHTAVDTQMRPISESMIALPRGMRRGDAKHSGF